MINFDEKDQQSRLTALLRKEAEEAAKRRAENLGYPYEDLNLRSVNTEALRVVPEEKAKEARLVLFEKKDRDIWVGVFSTENDQTKKLLKQLQDDGYKPKIHIVSEESLKKAFRLYQDISQTEKTEAGTFDISSERIEELSDNFSNIRDIKSKLDEYFQSSTGGKNTSRILEVVMGGGLAIDASDIHLEPGEKTTRLRYRLDGALIETAEVPTNTYRSLLSRIKLLSGMKLNISSEAQDGRFGINYGDSEIDIRVSVIPDENGESIVMRILNPESITVPLSDLGMYPRFLTTLREQIKKPNGMILTTGPTGSGKTTTLYACLREIYSPETKILTIENPVEYHLEGIVQTQTDEGRGYTFASGLRAALRQDPDVIMVGEIRDRETAETAVNAALTGHLVFSTLHTNNSAGTFARLLELGINPKVICSALNLSMAQRLVRKLCPNCKKEVQLEGKNKEKIDTLLSTIKQPEYLENLQTDKVWEAVGCKECNEMGYSGRVGLYEGILTTGQIEKIVIDNPSEREIINAARDQGLLFMNQDAVIKILQGKTSITEAETTVSLTTDMLE